MTLRHHLPLFGFAIATLTVYTVALLLTQHLSTLPQPDLLAAALTVDLVVLVPGLYYLLLVRQRQWPAVSVVPLFLLSLGAARLLLPAGSQGMLNAIGYLAFPLEVVLLGYLGARAYRLTQHVRGAAGDMMARMQKGFRAVLGPGAAARIAAFELAMLYYALGAWRARPAPDPHHFSIHRRSGYIPLLAGILIALPIEVVGLHLLVARWSISAAWVLTALSLYSALWILAEMNAVRLRHVEVQKEALVVRIGLRWTLRVPYAAIAGVYSADSAPPVPSKAHYLEATAMGKLAYLITLKGPLMAHGLYGIRKEILYIGLGLDEPDRFEATLRHHFEAATRHE